MDRHPFAHLQEPSFPVENKAQRKARRQREWEEEQERLNREEEDRKDAPGMFTREELEDFAAKYHEAKEKGFI